MCGERGKHRAQGFGGHLAVFFGFISGPVALAPLQSPELLAEKMGSQRKEHRPRAAAGVCFGEHSAAAFKTGGES